MTSSTDKALEAALPGEAEVVAWRVYHDWEGAPGEDYYIGPANNGSLDKAVAVRLSHDNANRIVAALASLQAMQARAEKAEEDARVLSSANASLLQNREALQRHFDQATVRAEKAERGRDEARLDRITAERDAQNMANQLVAAEARVKELGEENARLRRLDAEYGRVETAIIMADPDFDGDSPHDNCGDRLIASVHRLRDLAARTALKGGSNG